MKSPAQNAMMMGFGVALIVLLVIGLVAVRDNAQLATLNSEVNLNHEILSDIKDVLGALADSETAVRGFVLTHDQAFLEPYDAAQVRLDKALADLDRKLMDPEAAEINRRFVALARERNDRFPVAISVVQSEPQSREVMMERISEGRRVMDRVRQTGDQLQARELELLQVRTKQARELSRRTKIVVATGSILAILFLGAASFTANRDMRARLRAEDRLRETTTLQRAILDSANYSIVSTSPDGIIWTFNTSAQHWLQYSAEEIIGKQRPNLFHDPEEVRTRAAELSRELGREIEPGFEAFVAKAKLGERDEREWTYVRKDGSRFSVLLSISALYDTWGSITGFLGVASDITERKRAEQALRSAEETFRTLLQESSDIVTILTPQGIMKYVSPAVERLVGYKVDALTGQNVFNYIHPDDVQQAQESLQNTSDTPGYAVPLDLRLRRPDGSFVWVELIANNLLHDPNIQGVVINARDVTARHEMEKMKRDFISTVSHELRTPLTSIHGAIGLLATGKLGEVSEKGRRMLDVAVKNTDRLVRLVNDILDIERMDSGTVRMQLTSMDASELMVQAFEVMRNMADAAGVKLKVVPKEIQFSGDADRLMQMLTNLLSNAIKFSEPGDVVTLAAEQQGRYLHLTVQDEGRGIPMSKLETIFERFQQVDASDSREKGGTGLGLSICRIIAQQHGGRIWAESVENVGSTFHVELPLRRADRRSHEEEVSNA